MPTVHQQPVAAAATAAVATAAVATAAVATAAVAVVAAGLVCVGARLLRTLNRLLPLLSPNSLLQGLGFRRVPRVLGFQGFRV